MSPTEQHVVLLGDSIFDNALYVSGGEPLIDQLRSRLPRGARASLLAVDGAVISSVAKQLTRLPEDCSHIVLSVGGNNALEAGYLLNADTNSAAEVFAQLARVQCEFATEYRAMLRSVLGLQRPTVICTIYDAIPGLGQEAVTALSIFNDAIIRAGVEAGVPILDLRFICNDRRDYSSLSPIEPSEIGGSKIVRAIVKVLATHDFSRTETVVYG
jgi:hypothetical protein